MKLVMKCIHGSHLYGCSTPDSDTDYKGIFIPDMDDVLLGRAPKHINSSTGNDQSRNSNGDVDDTLYSLTTFIDMCCSGETIAIDMIHIDRENPNLLHRDSDLVWQFIRQHRAKFYTSNMKAFLGYVRKQAAKYGVKGSRLDAIQMCLDFLHGMALTYGNGVKVKLGDRGYNDIIQRDIASVYPEYVKVLDGFWKKDKWIDKTVLEVCGSKFDLSCPLTSLEESLQKQYDSYGHRAKLAKENQGIDWKAIHHAFRAALQLKEIYETGDLVYPLKDADFLLKVKRGEFDFTTEVEPRLDHLITQVEKLADESGLPRKVDREFWDNFILSVYKGELK